MADIPEWTPASLRPLLEQMVDHPACVGPRRAAFERLLTDRRLKTVYDELLRRDRKSGGYLHPARELFTCQTTDEAQ
jgi:hypothetical protein